MTTGWADASGCCTGDVDPLGPDLTESMTCGRGEAGLATDEEVSLIVCVEDGEDLLWARPSEAVIMKGASL